ncbi:Acg family FMN-binding oxidoreductase [Streptomyces sp. NPDC059349]|uniref:Acg family FMN-binding oxidoreductase n=1 Tax=Streptomyces sp. NPDC059349 TaxID=3346808 RepID=UPI0036CF81B0
MAPSLHNAQPWRFIHCTDSRSVALYGDPDRTLPYGDVEHRALHLGCGAALSNLLVVTVHASWTATVGLLPDPGAPWHLADAALDEAEVEDADRDLADLHRAIRRRHTSRFPFSDEQIPEPVFDGLRSAALLEGCRLITPSAWHADTMVMELVHDAELLEAANEAVRAEIATWTRTGRADEGPAADGIPADALGPRQCGVSSPVRDFDPSRRVPDRAVAVLEEHPQIAPLGTVQGTPADWLSAGQAMQRVLLQATLSGLATSLMSQPLEWPDLRSSVRDPNSAIGFVHMVFRLGYGPQGAATPRRPVTEVLSFE